jgi:glycosyltransferase involved in cell wall biosynthesis
MQSSPLVTVIVPAHNEEQIILETLQAIVSQKNAAGQLLCEWGELIVINDGSKDRTGEILEQFRAEFPFVQIVHNNPNRGLAASYNLGIRQAKAPIVVTCHADCRMADFDYLARMVAHFGDERVGAVTGKPAPPNYFQLSFVEKTYILTHIMDVEPEPATVREVNFAEGRCDAFRKCALEAVGLYNESTRISGEDQILAIEMRNQGYRIVQDTSLIYRLSCGSSQNSLVRIIRRQRVLAQGQAYIFWRFGFGTSQLADTAPNRKERKRLRAMEIVGVSILAPAIIAIAFFSWQVALAAAGLVGIARFALQLAHSNGRFRFAELVRMFPVVVACDVMYCVGFYRGLCLAWLGKNV